MCDMELLKILFNLISYTDWPGLGQCSIAIKTFSSFHHDYFVSYPSYFYSYFPSSLPPSSLCLCVLLYPSTSPLHLPLLPHLYPHLIPPTIQRHWIRIIPVSEVDCNWKGVTFTYWVYGFNSLVHAPDYPQKYCCGVCCSIL